MRPSGGGGELARLMLGQLFINACVTGMRMAAPLQALRLGHGAAAVGCLIALFALAQVFLALPAGRYCERHGLKRPVAWSVVVAMAGCAIAAAWPVFPALCASAVLTGAAGGVAIIAVQRHTGRIVSDPVALRKAFSWLALGLALSNVLGPVAAGVMIDGAGFRAAFLAIDPDLRRLLVVTRPRLHGSARVGGSHRRVQTRCCCSTSKYALRRATGSSLAMTRGKPVEEAQIRSA
jgi:MFS family permease